jgi:hypothetical protein
MYFINPAAFASTTMLLALLLGSFASHSIFRLNAGGDYPPPLRAGQIDGNHWPSCFHLGPISIDLGKSALYLFAIIIASIVGSLLNYLRYMTQ